MSSLARYAIYYSPVQASTLHKFGSAVLGYDAVSGCDIESPEQFRSSHLDWRQLTGDPRKYGFHATLKAPFYLAAEQSEVALIEALHAFAKVPRAMPIIKPVVRMIGNFVAIVPQDVSASLNELAQDCVEFFDVFRAAMTVEDRARRTPDMLSERQRHYLDRFGYPYIFEEFRFHMTLSGRLDTKQQEVVAPLLEQMFAALHVTELSIDRIALFKQCDPSARFRILHSANLEAHVD